MTNGLFFTLIIVFFFMLWLVGGGPTRPISFAGPFITPITNLGQTQSAYGPKVSGSITAGGSKISIGSKSAPEAGAVNAYASTAIPNTSAYAGKIFLSHYVSGTYSPDPSQEYLGLQVPNTTSQGVDISGWTVRSTVTGASARIPQGATLLTIGSVTIQDIILQPNSTAYVTTGMSPVNVSFERNACTNFLANQPHYAQCFADHSTEPGFFSGNWQIYLNKGERLWKNNSDTIELLDGNGKVVDSFSE